MSVPIDRSNTDLKTSTSSWVMVDESEKEKDNEPVNEMKQTTELENESENEEVKKPRKLVEDVDVEWWNDSDGISVISDPESLQTTDCESSPDQKPDLEVILPFPKNSITNIQPKPALKKSTNFMIAVSVIIGSFLIALYFNSEYLDDYDEDIYSVSPTTCNFETKPRADYVRTENKKYGTEYNRNKRDVNDYGSIEPKYKENNKYHQSINDKHKKNNDVTLKEKVNVNDRTSVYENKNLERSKNSPDKEHKNELVTRDERKRKGNFDEDHIKNYKNKKPPNKELEENVKRKDLKRMMTNEEVKEYLDKKEKYLIYKENQIKQKELKLYAKMNENNVHNYENKIDPKNNKLNKTETNDWYNNLHKERNKLRKVAVASEWVFDRSKMRNKKRDKAYWYFEWMDDREDVRYKKTIKS